MRIFIALLILSFPLAAQALTGVSDPSKVDLSPGPGCETPYVDRDIQYLDTPRAKRFHAYAEQQESVAFSREQVETVDLAISKKKAGEAMGVRETYGGYATKSPQELDESRTAASQDLAQEQQRLRDMEAQLTSAERAAFQRRDTEGLWVVLDQLLKPGVDYRLVYFKNCLH
jgi:hypothetical protein